MTAGRELLARVIRDLTRSMNWRRLVGVGIVAALLVAIALSSLALAGRSVSVSVDGKTVAFRTRARTVGGALRAGHIEVGPHDRVIPDLAAQLPRGASVKIIRAMPVTLKVDGQTMTTYTTSGTAAQALAEAGLTIGPDDRVVVTKDRKEVKADALEAGVTIEVIRRKVATVTEMRSIPAPVVYKDDAELPLGITQVAQDGRAGLARVTLQVVTENGRRVASKELNRQVVREPEMRVVLKGTSGRVTRGDREIQFKKAFQMVATAYYPGPDSTGPYANGYTSIGMKATYGVVAVDPNVIPLRSLLYIDGYGYAIAGDVGGAIKGNRIDLCYDTKQEALDWGKRTVMVFLIK